MNKSDIEHLRTIYDKLIANRYDPDFDYMIKFKSIIDELEKENMPETKRYRLEIPEDPGKEYDELAWAWHYENGNEINEKMSITISKPFSNWTSKFSHLPKSWLVEIKEEEPLTAEKWFKKDFPSMKIGDINFSGVNMVYAFREGEKNNELKHQEIASFDEWTSREGCIWPKDLDNLVRAEREMGWKAAMKSRGYE